MRRTSTTLNVWHSILVLPVLASLMVGSFNATAGTTRIVAAQADASGSVTIADHGSYSDVSQVASDTSQMSCDESIVVHQDGSATVTISYSYQLVDEQSNNGYETKRTVDITGSGTVQYDPNLYVTINQDGTYDMGFGTADPGVAAQETVAFEQTGQQTQTTQTTTNVHCQYNPNLLQGKLSGGEMLKNTDDEYGHWNTDEDQDDYGPSTITWTITDPAARGATSSGPPGPVPMPQELLHGSFEVDDQGSYSSTSSGQTITSQMTCKETVTVQRDGSATEMISYSYHRVEDQTSNGYENKHTVDIRGSGTVHYDPELNATIEPDGIYYLGLGTTDPGILVQETVSFEQTGQQTQTTQTTTSVHCQYNNSLLQGKLSLPCGQVLQITVSKDGYWNTDYDNDDYGPSKLIVEIDDPDLSCGAHSHTTPTTETATITPTETATVTPTSTVTTTPSGSRCSAKRVPGYAAPIPSPSGYPGTEAGPMPRKPARGRSTLRRGGAVPIRWQRTPQLTWADYKATPPKSSPWAAVTESGPGGSFSRGSYSGCSNSATGSWQTVVHYTLGSADALFYPSQSWVRAKYKEDTSSAASVHVLNHEQRHFDITEVYSRKLHAQLLTLLGGSTTKTITCAQWAACMKQVNGLDAQLKQTVSQIGQECNNQQGQYDKDTNHSQNEMQQQAWNTKIDGWLANPSSAP